MCNARDHSRADPLSRMEEKMNNSWFHRSLIAVASLVAIGLMLFVPARAQAAGGCLNGDICAVFVCGIPVACGYCSNEGIPCGCRDLDSGDYYSDGVVCADLIN